MSRFPFAAAAAAAGVIAVTVVAAPAGAATVTAAAPAHAGQLPESHRHHLIHMARLARARTAPARAAVVTISIYPAGSGMYSYTGLEQLWMSAGGPAWAAPHAASIAECESGGRVTAYNPSGATGLWQILGSVVPGNLYNPQVNAANAVSKFRASGDTFAQWVCK